VKIIVSKISIIFFLTMKDKFSFLPKKIVFVFLSAVLCGLWAGGAFEGYVVRFGLAQNFSIAEAAPLTGKIVRDVCHENQTGKSKIGAVTGYARGSDFLIRVNVRWNESDAGIFTAYPKQYFSKCIKAAE
jgi:hypothetical protein